MKTLLLGLSFLTISLSANADNSTSTWDKLLYGEKVTKNNKIETLNFRISKKLNAVTVKDKESFTKEQVTIFLSYAKAKARYYNY